MDRKDRRYFLICTNIDGIIPTKSIKGLFKKAKIRNLGQMQKNETNKMYKEEGGFRHLSNLYTDDISNCFYGLSSDTINRILVSIPESDTSKFLEFRDYWNSKYEERLYLNILEV